MLYITETQLATIIEAVKKLPIHTENFQEADEWVGLYLYLKKIETQTIRNEEVKEDGRPSDQ